MNKVIKELQKRIIENKKRQGFNTTDIKIELYLMYKEINEFFEGYLKSDKENMVEELADISIYALGIAEMLDVNLFEEIVKKMEINEKRIYHRDGTKSILEE